MAKSEYMAKKERLNPAVLHGIHSIPDFFAYKQAIIDTLCDMGKTELAETIAKIDSPYRLYVEYKNKIIAELQTDDWR